MKKYLIHKTLLTSILLLVSVTLTYNIAKAHAKEPIRVLMVGGGESHDFDTWYRGADVITLEKNGFAQVIYTDDVTQIMDHLPNIDVLFLSNNQPIKDQATRQAIFEFTKAGKGLVLAHAALWYNWSDWPEYNKELVSGGSRGHDPYGAFTVNIVKKHPVVKGVDKSFELKDELYYQEIDQAGPGLDVLATANNKETGKSFPSIFVVKNPDTRIVGIALGHDGEAHNIENYKKLVRNAVKWAASK